WLIVETRMCATSQQCTCDVSIWPAVVCGFVLFFLFFLSSSLFFLAEASAIFLHRHPTRGPSLLARRAVWIVVPYGMTWAGTGTSGGGVCRGRNGGETAVASLSAKDGD